MNPVPDRNQRKYEIGTAFRRAAHLPSEADPQIYKALLKEIGVATDMDMGVLCSILQDAIMTAVREERPTTPLHTFLDWLSMEQLHREYEDVD
ncbi:MAG: hypothetical protein IJ769_10365 [Clostridia bacterium]|nr:hypothetical protein [Clostridia bacterium]